MFTGIVHSTGSIVVNEGSANTRRLAVKANAVFFKDLELGASVAIDGVCLTVTDIHDDTMYFDVIASTLAHTALLNTVEGQHVNLERSLTQNSEFGGHDVSGHVDATGLVETINNENGNYRIAFKVGLPLIRYIFSKGFIAINGVSLTVGEIDRSLGIFSVWLIPETLRRTNLSMLKINDSVNIELHKGTQVIVDTISWLLNSAIDEGRLSKSNSIDFGGDEVIEIGNITKLLKK